MKAIRVYEFGDPSVLKYEDVPMLEAGAGQVLVRIHAVGVNPVDTYIRAGTHAIRPQLPYTPGSDAAGVVESLGEGVTGWAVGDRVYTARALTGAYAEFALCAAEDLHPLPAGCTFAQGTVCRSRWTMRHRHCRHS